ncbi:MAG: sigma-54 dependent transcriptional regulator [Candidatus Wallbacteria bacterium]|nr:sigma-54 dependent transcriptional regulator [Candidatus Wallbacteria bacterium]
MVKILVVDDEQKIQFLISESLKSEGYAVETAGSAEAALEKMGSGFDLILTDLRMPGMDGFDLIKSIRKTDRQTIIVVMTGYATIDNAINAIKEGADEYLAKPIKPFEIRRLVRRLLEERNLQSENLKLKDELKKSYSFEQFITQSQAVKGIFQKLAQIIDEDTTILLTGESGTGKDLLARLIHFNSLRGKQPFITFSLAARPEQLVNSELFGYKKGSFTGAQVDTPGAIGKASGGTLFLDEIGELKPEIQVHLLHFVQYKAFTPVGGAEEKADVRLIAATNRNLESMVAENRFREDLFYRLKVVHFEIPPLRERKEDIFLLSHFFLNQFNNQYHKNVHFSSGCYDQLSGYPWPGNVRELRHFVERLVLFSDSDLVEDISFETPQIAGDSGIDGDWPSIDDLNRRYIERVLRHTDGNKQKAAQILGIDQSTLWRKLKQK